MRADRKIEPEKIHLLNVRTLKGNIDSEAEIDPGMIQEHVFEFELGRGFDLEQQLVGLQLKVDIEAVGKSKEHLGIKGSYTHETVFRVENLDDFTEAADKAEDVIIDFLLMATLVGIAYSTVRGIIFSRTQGTPLGTVILPVVDPKRIMGEVANEVVKQD